MKGSELGNGWMAGAEAKWMQSQVCLGRFTERKAALLRHSLPPLSRSGPGPWVDAAHFTLSYRQK